MTSMEVGASVSYGKIIVFIKKKKMMRKQCKWKGQFVATSTFMQLSILITGIMYLRISYAQNNYITFVHNLCLLNVF